MLSANPILQASLAIGLEVHSGVTKCISKWFVVCVYYRFMPMEVLPPLHTRLING